MAAAILLLIVAGIPLWRVHLSRRQVLAAQAALSAGEGDRAVELLHRAARLRPNNAEVEYFLGAASRRTGNFKAMERHLVRAEALGFSPEDIQRQRLLAKAQAGEVDEAMPHISRWLEEGATDAVAEEIYEALAKGHLSQYRLADASQALDYWIEWQPQNVQARMLRGDVCERLNDIARAAKEYRAVLEVDPEHSGAAVKLGQSLLRLNEVREAQEQLDRVLAREPQNPAALVERVQCARRLGDPAEARRFAEAALEAPLDRTQRATVLTALAQTYLDERKPDRALPLLTEAVQLAPAESSIHHALGIAHTLEGDSELAQKHRERANQIREEYNRLTEITTRLLEAPQDADLRAEAGLIMMGQGMEDEGAQWLRTAVDCDPQHRAAHEALAAYYTRRGDQRRAASHRLMAAGEVGPEKAP